MVAQHAFWWLLNYKDSRWAGLGIDAELKSRGLYDPAIVTLNESIVPEPPPTKLPPAAEIATLIGDPKRGAAFITTCYLCHRVGDIGVEYGPTLSSFAKLQTTEVVVNAIVNPSADISHGYEGTVITLKDGKVIHGIVLSTGDPLVVQSLGGVIQLIPADKIQKQETLNRSLMLSGEQLGLGAQEIADVVAYLRSL